MRVVSPNTLNSSDRFPAGPSPWCRRAPPGSRRRIARKAPGYGCVCLLPLLCSLSFLECPVERGALLRKRVNCCSYIHYMPARGKVNRMTRPDLGETSARCSRLRGRRRSRGVSAGRESAARRCMAPGRVSSPCVPGRFGGEGPLPPQKAPGSRAAEDSAPGHRTDGGKAQEPRGGSCAGRAVSWRRAGGEKRQRERPRAFPLPSELVGEGVVRKMILSI